MNSFREWVKGVALFYIIILLMIFVPIIVVFIVLSIRTIVDLRYWIAVGIFVCILSLILFVYKRRKKYRKNLQKNKEDVLKILEYAIKSGHDVDISFMGGLLRISYKSKDKYRKQLSTPKKEPILLPESESIKHNNPAQLKD